MSKQEVPPNTGKPQTGLAIPQQNMLSREQVKEFKKRLRAETETDGGELERKRMLLAQTSAILGGISEAIMHPDTKPGEAAQMQASASLLGMKGMLDGIGLLVDCLTHREKITMDNGKPGFHRFSMGSHATEINEALYGLPPDPEGETLEEREGEPGLIDMIETGIDMLEEIGVAHKAFKDKHGVFDPKKYSDKAEPAPAPAGSVSCKKTSEAVAADEIQQAMSPMTPEEAIARLKKGGKS